jgi:hypothetical protein
MKSKGTIKGVQDLLSAVDSCGFAHRTNAHVRVWFRGQADNSWPLSPGIYRSNFPETDETKKLRIERHMGQDFRLESAGLFADAKDNAGLYFLQQHYRMPTRLLDWTNSPLAALYFAVEELTPIDSDGVLFILDAYSLAPYQKVPESKFRGIATSRNPEFKDALHSIFDWREPPVFPSFIMPVRPDRVDKRVVLQKGCFTFHPPGNGVLNEMHTDSLLPFIVPKGSKKNLKNELFLLGIDPFSIYGDLESLAARLKFAYRVLS